MDRVVIYVISGSGKKKKNVLLELLHIVPYPKLNQVQMAELYRRIRGVIVPSIVAEPLPYIVSESILRGRAIIASDIGGIPELVNGCKGSWP